MRCYVRAAAHTDAVLRWRGQLLGHGRLPDPLADVSSFRPAPRHAAHLCDQGLSGYLPLMLTSGGMSMSVALDPAGDDALAGGGMEAASHGVGAAESLP